ncbi:MAG: ribosomal protein S18-alanine N-acetyltransferase [Lachnospiraceae bacterium]|nr:ribosomal protein S18-alanine N-acetyltransferase [Lachnospiraceae bacterium]
MVQIRRLREEDVEALSVMAKACFSVPWSAKAFAELVDDEKSIYLVAVCDKEVIGCCGVVNSYGDGDIDIVMVAEKYRGKGIAQVLLQELMKQGREMGVENFTLEVRVSNAPAIHVYEKLGFVSEGIRPRFYEKPVEDAMIMWLRG